VRNEPIASPQDSGLRTNSPNKAIFKRIRVLDLPMAGSPEGGAKGRSEAKRSLPAGAGGGGNPNAEAYPKSRFHIGIETKPFCVPHLSFLLSPLYYLRRRRRQRNPNHKLLSALIGVYLRFHVITKRSHHVLTNSLFSSTPTAYRLRPNLPNEPISQWRIHNL
jgi:hypothetical protein